MKDKEMAKTEILMVLEKHVGKANAITADEIVLQVDEMHSDGKTQGPTRGMITELLREMSLMVASCCNGYFIAETKEEVHEYLESLNNRIKGIIHRKADFKENAVAGGLY